MTMETPDLKRWNIPPFASAIFMVNSLVIWQATWVNNLRQCCRETIMLISKLKQSKSFLCGKCRKTKIFPLYTTPLHRISKGDTHKQPLQLPPTHPLTSSHDAGIPNSKIIIGDGFTYKCAILSHIVIQYHSMICQKSHVEITKLSTRLMGLAHHLPWCISMCFWLSFFCWLNTS